MKRYVLGLLGLALPFMAMAQTAPDLVVQGSDKKIHGDFKGALADYTQAIAQNPANIKAYLGRATVRSLEGNYEGAIADDTRAIALDPKNALAFSNRGNARTAKGDLSGALSDYTQAVTLDSHHIRAFLNRGNIKNLEKKYSAAIDDYTTVISLDPKNTAAYYNRAGAKRAIADYTGASADYSKAIELNPVDVQAYLNRAVLEMAQKNWDGATTDLKKCVSLIPEERQAYARIYLWVVGVKRGETEEALRALSHYLSQSPKVLSGTWGWEIAKYLAGHDDEAHFLVSASSFQAQKNRGQLAQACYYVGLKRAIAGDKAGSTTSFDKCQKTGNPSLHEFILAREELRLSGDSK